VLTCVDLCRRAEPGETVITKSLQRLAGRRATFGLTIGA